MTKHDKIPDVKAGNRGRGGEESTKVLHVDSRFTSIDAILKARFDSVKYQSEFRYGTYICYQKRSRVY